MQRSLNDNSPRATVSTQIVTGYTVTGTVQDINRQGLAGVSVQVAGRSATTDGSGNYTVSGITTTGNQVVKLSKNGKTLERPFTIYETTPKYNMGVTYMVDAYLIFGMVYNLNNEPVAGIRVGSGSQYAVTGSNGQYQIMVPTAGTHTVTIKQSGYKEVSTSGYVTDANPNASAASHLYAISMNQGYRIEGSVQLPDKAVPYSSVSVTVGNKTVTPNSEGYFKVVGITEPNTYNVGVTVNATGYVPATAAFSVNDNQPIWTGAVFGFGPNLTMSLATSDTKIQQGGTIIYTVNITNQGNSPAREVKMFTDPNQPLPAGVRFISAKPLGNTLSDYDKPAGGGISSNCNITAETRTLDCKYLGTLGGQQTTQMEVVVGFGIIPGGGSTSWGIGGGSGGGIIIGGSETSWWLTQPFSLTFLASGKGCTDCTGFTDGGTISTPPATSYVPVEPYLSLNIAGGANQVTVGDGFSYVATVHNSEKSPSAVKNTKLKITLPAQVKSSSVTSDQGQCVGSDSIITCDLATVINNSTVTINLALQSVLVGQGNIGFTLTSEQAPAVDKKSNTFSVIPLPPTPPPMPVGDADLMFIIDDTGSMVEELTALGNAISEYMTLFGQTGPNVGLVTFKDNVTNRILGSSGGLAATNNMNWLLNGYSNFITGIKQLKADGGADCPEASLKALDTAKDLVKVGGRMIVITDASSHPDVDVDTLITALRAKGVRVDVILSGEECTGLCGVDTGEANKDSISAINTFSRIASETGGLFVTPFEVNDNSTTGKTYYQKVAVNLLKSSVSPTVTTVTPNAIPQGTTTDVVLNAANVAFNTDSEVSFGSDITVNTVEMISPTQLKANITVASNASVKFYDVTVATTNGAVTDSATGIGVVEVVANSTQPTILSITPDSIMRGGNAEITVNMANTQLAAGTTLSFESGSGIVVKSIKINTVTSLTATLDVSNAQLGTHKMSIKTNGVEISTDCSMKASPKDGAVLITPNLTEGTVPYLTQVTPNRGTQGAVREITIDAINTHFVQDVTELRFGTDDIYVLKLNITSATQAVALIQIDSEAELGLTDIYMYTDDEFASILEGFEVVAKGPYSVEGCILDAVGAPIADVQLDTGEQLAFSDNSCFFRIEGLNEGEYTLNLGKTGYQFNPVDLIVSNNTAINGVVRLPTQTPTSSLVVDSRSDNWNIYQGDTVTHTITATNYGEVTATGVVLRYQLPSDMTLVSAEALGGGQCQPIDNLLTCTLSDIGINQQAMVKLTLHSEGSGTLMNEFELLTNEYPVSIKKSWTTVNPYLSVAITDSPDPVLPTSSLYYSVVVELSAYAAEMSKTKATGVILVDYLPSNVTFKEVVTDENTTCDTSKLPAITCQISDLSIENPGDISRVTVGIRVTLDDPGLLLVVNEARVSSNEFPIHKARERTVVNIGEGTVDAAIVLDITGSMQEEINGSVRAISQLIDKLGNNAAPVIGLVVFKDSVTVQAVTSDLALLKKTLSGLVAEGGGTCPEASVEAIERIIPHLKQGGAVIFASDAAPYEDADIDGLAAKLKAKQIKLTALLSGNCSNTDAWNDIATELSQ